MIINNWTDFNHKATSANQNSCEKVCLKLVLEVLLCEKDVRIQLGNKLLGVRLNNFSYCARILRFSDKALELFF